MSFYATSFIYDGIPSETYGLVLSSFNGNKQTESKYGGEMQVFEDRVAMRSTGLHYGTSTNKALSFPVVFTLHESNEYLDRYDAAAVAGWLTGHQQYKKLIICQPDMEGIYYKCLITDLVACEVGGKTVGFNATIVCDGPYAYRSLPPTKLSTSGTYSYQNFSNVNGYYRPIIEVECEGTMFSIQNNTDDSSFTLTGMPAKKRIIMIDCLNQVMTSNDHLNLYQYWNIGASKCFPRFVRGDNSVTISGAKSTIIRNDFPWNIGN